MDSIADPSVRIQTSSLSVLFDARHLGHEANEGLGLMNVEVITDDVPTGDQRISRYHRLEMGQEIFFGARGTTKGSHQLSCHDIATQDKATRSMTFILEFASLHMTWCQREVGMLAFERLYARQLIGTDGAFTLLSDHWGLLIHPTDRSDGLVFLWVLRWG